MKKLVCTQYQSPTDLNLIDTTDPIIDDTQILVQVKAVGLNYVDGLLVQGQYQMKVPTPFTPGGEISGIVVCVGKEVSDFKVGDRILANVGIGGLAEYVSVYPRQGLVIPDCLDFPVAATLSQSYTTALFSLRERGRLTAGEKLLVLGAGGGVGLAACDVGQALGAEVIAAASSEAKLKAAESAGATSLINYTAADLKTSVRQMSGGGVDLVFDPVGGDHTEPALRTLKYNGRLLVIGFASGSIASIPANQVLLRNRQLVGVDWGAWSMTHFDDNRLLVRELLDWITEGKLHPPIPHQCTLATAGDNMQALLDRQVVGKIAVVCKS